MTTEPNNVLKFFQELEAILWGWPMLILLIMTGLYLTFTLKGLQIRYLLPSLKLAFMPQKKHSPQNTMGDISHFQALMTALSATVGTGNIAGVATAISFGGPGALFWMWITGFLGMATKYSEAVLGVHYRRKGADGTMSGGPMYYIYDGLNHFKFLKKYHLPYALSIVFAVLLVIATFNLGGMVQSNSVAEAIANSLRGTDLAPANIKLWVGMVLAIITSIVIAGGIKRIGNVSAALVPFMILLYIGVGVFILCRHAHLIDDAFRLIFESAFQDLGKNVLGGFLGASVKEAMRFGFSRGVFSNESGLGSAPIAAAAAKTNHPVAQGLVSMTQTFIDTIVVCTFTGLIILVSGLWWSQNPEALTGAALTAQAFGLGLGGAQVPFTTFDLGEVIVTACIIFFAYSSIIGWYYYGEKGIQYLFKQKALFFYKIAFVGALIFGAMQSVPLIWTIASVMISFMVIPNLIALLLLSGQVKRLTKDFMRAKNNKLNAEQSTPFNEKAFFHQKDS